MATLEAWALVVILTSATSPEKHPVVLPLTWHATESTCRTTAVIVARAHTQHGQRVESADCWRYPRGNVRPKPTPVSNP